MKVINISLPRKHKEVEIVTLADLHIGDKHTDEKINRLVD